MTVSCLSNRHTHTHTYRGILCPLCLVSVRLCAYVSVIQRDTGYWMTQRERSELPVTDKDSRQKERQQQDVGVVISLRAEEDTKNCLRSAQKSQSRSRSLTALSAVFLITCFRCHCSPLPDPHMKCFTNSFPVSVWIHHMAVSGRRLCRGWGAVIRGLTNHDCNEKKYFDESAGKE